MDTGAKSLLASLTRLLHGPRERVALDYLLAQADPSAPLAERVAWLTELLRWIRMPEPPSAVAGVGASERPGVDGTPRTTDRALRLRVARVRFLLQLLERHPEWKSTLARTLRSVLRDTHGLRLFANTGLPEHFGFWGETVRRITGRLLPEPPLSDDLAQVFYALFPERDDERLPLAVSYETLADLGALLRFEEPETEACWAVLRRDLDDAVVVLAAQVAAIGLSDEVRRRTSPTALAASPFALVSTAAEDFLAAAADGDAAARAPARMRLTATVAGCRRALADVIAHLEAYGVSVGLVYRIEVAHRQLDRLDALVGLAAGEDVGNGAVARFVAVLIRNMHAQRSARALFRSNLDLLTRKIAERTGKTGEHYITRNRAEYAEMLRSAGRGGALTGFTVVLKFALVGRGLAPFVEGLAASLNYAVSFCAIQFVHGTLATKQPAMTAAAMAAQLKLARHRGRLRAFVDEVAALTRSQVAAILGNLVFVVPAALLVEATWNAAGGAPIPAPEKATATIASLSILGATPLYAGFTGVLLWFSAVLSGWIENWATYRRLPEGLAAQPRLVYAFGAERMERVADWFARNVAGLGGNIALGFLLGMTPLVAAFFGIPLDVRHVTLSTGALALAASTLGTGVFATAAFWLACAGIAIVGALNLGVSFTLALWVAIRATRAGALSRRRVYRAVVARFLMAPRDFLLPPRPVAKA